MTQIVTLRTGSWFTPLPADHLRIGTSRGVPRFGAAGKGYRRYTPLHPGPWLTAPDLTERYLELLGKLDPDKVVADLARMADGRVGVLCCFEQVGAGRPCHRLMVTAWLHDRLGLAVPELGHEHIAPPDHPLSSLAGGRLI